MSLVHSTRTDDAFNYLRQKIIEGEIEFGARLHIANLAEETGFSTTPIREALVKLEMCGLAESYPHRGVYVVQPEEQDLLEMIDGRLCIELFLARFVIEFATAEDIADMYDACNRAANTSVGPEVFYEHGLHGVYVGVARNGFLQDLYSQGMALLNVLYIHGLRACTDETWVQDYRKQHYEEELQIIEAVEARDLQELERRVTIHINNFRDFILTTGRNWTPRGLTWDKALEPVLSAA